MPTVGAKLEVICGLCIKRLRGCFSCLADPTICLLARWTPIERRIQATDTEPRCSQSQAPTLFLFSRTSSVFVQIQVGTPSALASTANCCVRYREYGVE